jgi:hypothetical protein
MPRMALIDIAGAGGGKRGRLGGDVPVLPESSGGPAGWARRNLEGATKFGGRDEIWRARRNLEGATKFGGRDEIWRARPSVCSLLDLPRIPDERVNH